MPGDPEPNEEQPAPVPPEMFAEPRRAVGHRSWPRLLGVLASIAGVAAAGFLWFEFSLGRALTVFGLGLDICGVWMLASGVVMTPRDLAHVGTWGDMGRGARRAAVHDRTESLAGLWLAVAGFTLQLVANLLPAHW
jgi:hypothetical protein